MAKIIPIDILKCVSGKFGGGKSKKYFATNKHTLINLTPLSKHLQSTQNSFLFFYLSPNPTSHFLQNTYKLSPNSTFLSNKTKFQKNCHTKRVVHLAFNANFADKLKK